MEKLGGNFSLRMEEGECPRCGGQAGAVVAAGRPIQYLCDGCQRLADVEREVVEREEAVGGLLQRSGETARLRRLSLETYPKDPQGRRVIGETREWHRRALEMPVGVPNLLLFGPRGTGKTGLAWSFVRSLCENLVEARIVLFRDFLAELRDAFRGGDRRPSASASLGRVPVLALDDLGAERPTDFARDELATIVEARYQALLPTIVTSNYDPGELARRLGHDEPLVGERIVSRLQEDAIQVRFEGRDRRV